MIIRFRNFIPVLGLICASFLGAQDKAEWIPHRNYTILDSLDKVTEQREAAADSLTKSIRDRQDAEKKARKDKRKSFVANFKNVKKPSGPSEFMRQFAFPPVAQYESGMCWCFSMTSFIESEMYRLHGDKIKLSELHTVYWEYVEKARRYIRERGESAFGEGSESNAVLRIMALHGAAPASAYTGLLAPDTCHNHVMLFNELESYLHYCRDTDIWDENTAITGVKSILNKYLGTPPEHFEFQNKSYTPQEFFTSVVKLSSDDYIDVMSSTSLPFYKFGLFDVPDNWWRDSSYYNIPLDEWVSLLQRLCKNGVTTCIGGDVSEPGYYGEEDAAFIPDFDIPSPLISQDAREYRIRNGSTEDDHGIHLIGSCRKAGHDWYLIKDSSQAGRLGKFTGYLMYRDDYVKLKMLSYSVPRDMMKDLLKKQ